MTCELCLANNDDSLWDGYNCHVPGSPIPMDKSMWDDCDEWEQHKTESEDCEQSTSCMDCVVSEKCGW